MLRPWWVLAAVACGTFMATLDSSIVNIALPTLTKELSTTLSHSKWVIVIYLFSITCLLLPIGRLSDLYGRKNLFQMGFGIFTLGSTLCGLAPRLEWLVAARVIQGIGGAMIMANSPAIVTMHFPPERRGGALGTLSMVVSLGLLTGPGLGGLIIATMGWRSIFFLNVPVGLVGMYLIEKFVKPDVTPNNHPFDWPGSLLQFVFLAATLLIANHQTTVPIGPLVLIAVIALIFFIRFELKAKAPLFDMTLIRNETFWTANLGAFLLFLSYSAFSVLMPFYLEEVLNFSPERAGAYLTTIPLTILIFAPIAGRLSDRYGSKELCILGSTVSAISLLLISGFMGTGLDAATKPLGIILSLATIGLGNALFQSPNNNAIMDVVPHPKLGVASALLATLRNLGIVTGTGVATAIFTWHYDLSSHFVRSLHFTLMIAGFIGMGAILASLGKRPDRRKVRKIL